MIKQCKECKSEFESINTKGSEQLYCSKSCRQKSANKRFQNNIINKYKNEKQESNNVGNQEIFTDSGRINERVISHISRYGQRANVTDYPNDIIVSIKETYDAKNECLFYKLKCEALEKEVQDLKQDIVQLEMELDECNSEDENDNGIISGLMTSFKQDPQNTISFATELITNFIKPKKTA